MQQTLSNELRGLIERRVRAASPNQILAITSALCADEPRIETLFPLTADRLPEFEVQGDTVLDRRTGLMWSRQNIAGGRKSWIEAKKAAEGCSLGGYGDWRLPTIRELLSIVDYERHNPAIDTTVFECSPDWYWTSTPLNSSPGVCAWYVFFDDGDAGWYGQGGNGFVRACRPGQ